MYFCDELDDIYATEAFVGLVLSDILLAKMLNKVFMTI